MPVAFIPPESDPSIDSVNDAAPEWDSDDEGASRPEKRKGIRPQSAKAKGRRLQQWAASKYKESFPHLEGNDVKSVSMGAAGDDLILSPAALKVLPYAFEMKNVEKFPLWATLRQAERRINPRVVPCAVVKRNRIEPVTIVPFGHLMLLLRCGVEGATIDPPPMGPYVSVSGLLRSFQLEATGKPTEDLFVASQAAIKFATRDLSQGELDGDYMVVRSSRAMALGKSKFNFWKVWDTEVERFKGSPNTPLLVFNRGNADTPMYAAMPFGVHVGLLHDRWKRVGP